MPILGVLTGRIDFSDKVWVLRAATDGNEAIAIGYGAFLNAILEFLIIALAIFIIVKQVNRLKRQKEEAPPESPSEEILLLREIRDALIHK
jgi:large conductance mechanosensitive channel